MLTPHNLVVYSTKYHIGRSYCKVNEYFKSENTLYRLFNGFNLDKISQQTIWETIVTTQNVVTLQNVVVTTFCLATALTSIGKM